MGYPSDRDFEEARTRREPPAEKMPRDFKMPTGQSVHGDEAPVVTTRPLYLADKLRMVDQAAAMAAAGSSDLEIEMTIPTIPECVFTGEIPEDVAKQAEGRQHRDVAHPKFLMQLETAFRGAFPPGQRETTDKERLADRMTREGFTLFQNECHANAVRHGFWDGPDNTNLASKVALMHSELSELLEVYRGKAVQKEGLVLSPEEEEMADVLIRLCDLAGHRGIDLFKCALTKHAFNLTRPHKHGRNF